MKNIVVHLLIGVSVIVIVLLLFRASEDTNANSPETSKLIRKVARQFREEQAFNDGCYIDGVQVSLSALVYGIGVAEGGFKPGSVGIKTNNPGSLHKEQGQRKPVKLIYADGTHTRPVYASLEDGLYEKMYLIASPYKKYHCNFTVRAVSIYITGKPYPNQNVYNRIKNAKGAAIEFDATKSDAGEVRIEQPKLPKENLYLKARKLQDEADRAWFACIKGGFCF